VLESDLRFGRGFPDFFRRQCGKRFHSLKLELCALEFVSACFIAVSSLARAMSSPPVSGRTCPTRFRRCFSIQIVLGLRLRIEFDQEGIFFHMGAGGTSLVMTMEPTVRSFELGGQDHEGTRGLRRSIQANYLPEIFLSTFTVDSPRFRARRPRRRCAKRYGIATRSRKAAPASMILPGFPRIKWPDPYRPDILRRNPKTNTLSGVLDFRSGD